MKGPRPITLLLGALALAGVAKATSGLLVEPSSEQMRGSPFLSPAYAGGGAPTPAPATEDSAALCAPTPQPICETPELMLQALTEERDLLDAQKARLEQRQTEIALAEEKLKLDQSHLTELKTELELLLATIRKSQTDDVDRLVSLYSAMKPKDAAAIMDDLDIEVSVMVLGTMPERNAAPILAKLNKTRARAISRIILERSKLPGDQRLDNLKL
jgi:flagellar motility protein MotE (MotC chaperone)